MKKITLIIIILGVFIISNAQIEIKELKLTPEIEEMVVAPIKNMYEKSYFDFGIKDKSQLEHLRLGKPIPNYWIVSEKIEHLSIWQAAIISDEEPLSLNFINNWTVPVMVDEEPLLFVVTALFGFIDAFDGIKNTKEHFHNYELKDSIIGSIGVESSMDYLIIRKENQDIFVEVYDEVTGEYFKNEYRFSELINHLKELGLRKRKEEMEAQRRYLDKVANKNELNMTPEITEMLDSILLSHIKNLPDDVPHGILAAYGATNRSQLTNLQLGKPIPIYDVFDNEIKFIGKWKIPLMSDGVPLSLAVVSLTGDGQYTNSGGGSAGMAKLIHNYEYKDLIVGILDTGDSEKHYLIIRKENQDIYVQTYDYATREYLKNEYSFNEVLNLLKK